jgi:hypothetical protein
MANQFYGLGRDKFANAGINWTSDTIRAYLIDPAVYPVSINTDEFLDDIAAGAKVAFAALTGNSSALGTCDANDTVLPTVTGAICGAIVLAKWTGTEGTSALIGYIDTATGLPITPNGGDITLTWSDGANRIFTL